MPQYRAELPNSKQAADMDIGCGTNLPSQAADTRIPEGKHGRAGPSVRALFGDDERVEGLERGSFIRREVQHLYDVGDLQHLVDQIIRAKNHDATAQICEGSVQAEQFAESKGVANGNRRKVEEELPGALINDQGLHSMPEGVVRIGKESAIQI
jgi:hypothetical protein